MMNKKNSFWLLLVTLAIDCLLMDEASAQNSVPLQNIALGKNVVIDPPARYGLMKSDDPRQLTDGKFATGDAQLWTRLGAMTWSHVNPVTMTIDLGSVQPISGVSYSTGANKPSRIFWPESILVGVSEDNKTWHFAGDLVKASANPPGDGSSHTLFQYKTTGWKVKGRYVSLGVTQKLFTVTDEIEVFRGQGQWLDQPLGEETFSSMKELAQRQSSTRFARARIASDIAQVRQAVRQSALSPVRQRPLLSQLDQCAAELPGMPLVSANFRTIFPFNEIHRRVFAVYGKLLAAEKIAPLTLWQQQRYGWLPLFSRPQSTRPELKFSMLGNQHRSDALLLTNASGSDMTVNLTANEPAGGMKAGWLQVAQVEFTDTVEDVAVADALVPLKPDAANSYSVTVPAGMTRKVWFTANSSLVPAGKHEAAITVKAPSIETIVPLSLRVAGFDMMRPRLGLTMWDYSSAPGGVPFGVTKQNQPQIIELMRSHYVDTAWSNEWGVRFGSLVTAKDFDANNKLINADFSRLKQWREQWPDARRYFIFLGSVESKPNFAGAKMGTPAFNARLGNWSKALLDYLPEIGLKPEQLALCIVDEAHSEAEDAIIEAWARAIKQAAPQLQVFTDPMWRTPETNKNQAALQLPDIICVKPPVYFNGSQETQQYFKDLQSQGKDLWFYKCSGPVRLFEPQQYYRTQAWLAFAAGAKGHGFWSFTDAGNAISSWNEYSISRQSFTPAFIDDESVNSSLHWEAVRDGMQDSEELAMLRDAIEQAQDAILKAKAQKVLDEAIQAVAENWKNSSGVTAEDIKVLPPYRAEIEKHRRVSLGDWRLRYDPDLIDQQADRVREMLIVLQARSVKN